MTRFMASAAGPSRMTEFYKLATVHQLMMWADLKHGIETDRHNEEEPPSTPSSFRL
jgi:hypothetical protein